MNPNIILGGNSVDYVNVLAQSNQAAQQRINYDQQNALSRTIQQNGPGIMAGDPNALNALARFDPQAALGVQSTRLGMDAARQEMGFNAEKMQMAREESKRVAAERLATNQDKITKEQAAAEAAEIERGVAAAMSATTPEQWDQIVTQYGQPDLVGQFGNREAIVGSYMGAADAFKAFNPVPPDVPAGFQALQLRAQEAGLQSGTPEYQKFMATEGKQQDVMTVYSADGKPIVTTGNQPVKLTEQQSKIALFGSMMDSTMPVINDLEAKMDPANVQDRTAAALGTVGNFLKTGEYQRYEAAGKAWAEAALRLQTGAAATEGEVLRIFSTYFAQAGDDPETVKYKQELRDQYAKAVAAASGGSFAQPGQTPDPVTPPASGSDLPPEIQALSPSAQALYEKYRVK